MDSLDNIFSTIKEDILNCRFTTSKYRIQITDDNTTQLIQQYQVQYTSEVDIFELQLDERNGCDQEIQPAETLSSSSPSPRFDLQQSYCANAKQEPDIANED